MQDRVKILSIQSWVAAGHVGNAAALFPLQLLGAEVLAVHTVQFSNHPGHGAFTGRALPPEEIAALIEGLRAHGALAACDAILTGYLGDAALGDAVLDAVRNVRATQPGALWCCDPVMGDDGRIYVRPGIPEFFAREAVPQADILTPNQFELSVLSGTPCATLAEVRLAAERLRMRLRPDGPRIILVSSLQVSETPDGSIDMLLCSDDGAWLLRSARLPATFSGAGDTLAALFLFHILSGQHGLGAATHAARSMAGLLRETWERRASELLTVQARHQFIQPDGVVAVTELGRV